VAYCLLTKERSSHLRGLLNILVNSRLAVAYLLASQNARSEICFLHFHAFTSNTFRLS
jgi:hypothetical protein